MVVGKGARETFAALYDSGKTPLGLYMSSSDPAMTESVGHAEFDFVVIDGEHSPMGPAEMLPLVRSAELTDMIPLIRVWENSRPLIQKMLEIGAEGILIPHIDTAEQAAAAVSATRLPVNGGERSRCPTNHACGYSRKGWAPWIAHTLENLLVIPIIESRLALENFEEIAAVDGIEYLYYGHGDLAESLGVDMNSQEIADGWVHVQELAAKHGKKLITTYGVPGLQKGQAQALLVGMDFIEVSRMYAELQARVRAEF